MATAGSQSAFLLLTYRRWWPDAHPAFHRRTGMAMAWRLGQLPCVSPAGDGGQLGRGPQGELAHPDQVLRDLGQALLVLVHQEFGPVLKVLVHLQTQRQGTSAVLVSVFGQTCSLYTRGSLGARVWQACSCVPRTWASAAGASSTYSMEATKQLLPVLGWLTAVHHWSEPEPAAVLRRPSSPLPCVWQGLQTEATEICQCLLAVS